MLNPCLRYVAVSVLAGPLFANTALADSKGGGSGGNDAYSQCVALAVQNYNIALQQCPPPGTYGRPYCEGTAYGTFTNEMARCSAGKAAILRGGSSAMGSGIGTMHGVYGGENGGDGSAGSRRPAGSVEPHRGQFPRNNSAPSNHP